MPVIALTRLLLLVAAKGTEVPVLENAQVL